jgi:hypothetical protein
MRRHTLFLLQGRDVQRATVESMTEWSELGLLHRISFLDLDQLDTAVRAQDLVHFVLEEGRLSEPIQLLAWLVQHNCEVIRLVTLHTADEPGGEADGVRKAEKVRAEMLQWLGERQRMVSIACFLVDPDRARFDAASAMPTWAANLVISPTDQALPSGAAAPVAALDDRGQHNPVFADVASQNLCTIGGAWRFMEAGPLDDARAGNHAAGVQVIRSFVRCVDLEDPTPAVTANALERTTLHSGTGWPLPTTSPTTVPAIPPGPFIESAAAQLGDRHAGAVDAVILPPTPARPRTQVGLWTAIKLYFGFLIRGVVAAPGIVLNSAVVAASTAASMVATSMIFGRSSEYEVKVGRPRLRPSSNPEDVQRAVGAAALMADPTSTFMPPATRDLWQEYVRIGLALLDGSSMPPEQIRPQIGDARAVVQDPGDIAVRSNYPTLDVPGPALGQSAGVQLDANDPLTVILTRDALQARLTALTDKAPPGDDSDGDTANPKANSGAAPTETATASTSAGREHDTRRLADIRRAQQALGEVDKWVTGTREPYTWKVGVRLARSLADSQVRFLHAANELEQLQRRDPDTTEVRTTQIWAALAVGAVFALVVAVFGLFGLMTWDLVATVAIVSLLVGLFISFRTFLSDLKRRFQLLHAYETGVDAQNEATRAFSHYARETLRLNSVYWQYLRWTPILSTVLHDPFAGTPDPAGEPEPVFIASAPQSTRSATARPDPVRLETLTNEARRRIFTTGWATRCWQAGSTALLDAFHAVQAIDDGIDPFEENVRQPLGALEYLRSGFTHGAHGPSCRDAPVRAVAQLITSSPLSSLTAELLVDGTTPYPDTAAPSDADPAEGLFQEILPSDHTDSFPAYLWTAGGLQAPVDVRQTVIARVPSGGSTPPPPGVAYIDTVPVSHGGQLLFAAARVDLSEPCQSTELIVFRSDLNAAAAPAAPVFQPSDDDGD